MSILKKLVFTEQETLLLKNLCNGCNVAMYRTGNIRLRDKDHNPIRNIRSDLWDKIKPYCIQREGLFYINPEKLELFSTQILNG